MTKLHVNQQRLGDKMSRNIVLCGREIHNPIHTTEWHYVADDPDFTGLRTRTCASHALGLLIAKRASNHHHHKETTMYTDTIKSIHPFLDHHQAVGIECAMRAEYGTARPPVAT